MKHRMTLDYTIPEGSLQPYFDALRKGEALASQCGKCGFAAFPARTQCARCGSEARNWTPLNGTARVIFRTDGGNGSFALVQFDGADTQSTVAIRNPSQISETGRLSAPRDDQSGLWLDLNETL